MKKLLLLFTLSILTLTSCSDDDDGSNGENNETNIVGSWRLTSITENGQNAQLDPCDLMDTLTFRADNTGTDLYFFDANGDGTCTGEFHTFEYSINENNITFEFEITYTMQIETLNSTTLSLREEDENNGNVDVFINNYTRI